MARILQIVHFYQRYFDIFLHILRSLDKLFEHIICSRLRFRRIVLTCCFTVLPRVIIIPKKYVFDSFIPTVIANNTAQYCHFDIQNKNLGEIRRPKPLLNDILDMYNNKSISHTVCFKVYSSRKE